MEVWYCLFNYFDPSTLNVHNLATPLNCTNFDGKIKIYIQFCIQQSILKNKGWFIWGREASAPKYKNLAGGTPNVHKEGDSTWPVGEKLKTLQQSCNLAPGLQPVRKQVHLLSISAVPQPKTQQNSHFCPTWVVFWVSLVSHDGFWEEVHFHFVISLYAELKLFCTLFEKNCPTGWDMRACMRAFQVKMRNNGPF